MARDDTNLTPAQERALAALMNARTVDAAAMAAHVSRRTLQRWLKLPVFATAYRDARAQAVAMAISLLQQVSGEAVITLAAILQDADVPAAVRVQAASKILDLALRATEFEELKRRVEDLEQHRDMLPDEHGEEASVVA